MNGIPLAEAGHFVNALPPVSISGGKTAQAFSMKGAEHVSIYISFGVMGSAVPTSIVVNQCTNAAGANPVALASFRYWYQLLGGAGNDILNGAAQALSNAPSLPPNWTTSASGITSFPTTVANLVYVIEIDSAELMTPTVNVVGTVVEYPYLQVVIADSGNTTYAQVTAILTGLRFAYNVGNSQTV
jgi:hypothetical protein